MSGSGQPCEANKPELHVEATLKYALEKQACWPGLELFTTNAEFELLVGEWLKTLYAYLTVRREVSLELAGSPLQDYMTKVYVDELVGPGADKDWYILEKVKLVVHAFELHGSETSSPQDKAREGLLAKTNLPARYLNLPHVSLDNLWSSLKFDTIDPKRILRSISRMMELLRKSGLNDRQRKAFGSNRLILFHGPPGCGKTSLCRALAQKLSIRLNGYFNEAILFEMNTQDLLSKYYSESGRLVTEMFDKIVEHAGVRGTNLICVLIDEVESIATSRELLSESGECHDSVRATNQLLTALDRIAGIHNIVVFCTSNMKESIDRAFLDRVDYEFEISTPSEGVVYEILRSTLNQMMDAELVYPPRCNIVPSLLYHEDRSYVCSYDEDRSYVCSYEGAKTLEDYPKCAAQQILNIARHCKNWSGRKLKRLPIQAITALTYGDPGDPVELEDVIEAMKKTLNIVDTAAQQEATYNTEQNDGHRRGHEDDPQDTLIEQEATYNTEQNDGGLRGYEDDPHATLLEQKATMNWEIVSEPPSYLENGRRSRPGYEFD